MKKSFVFLFSLFLLNFFPQAVLGQEVAREEILEAEVLSVLEKGKIEIAGSMQEYQKLELLVTKGSLKDQKIIVENGTLPTTSQMVLKKGDKVMLVEGEDFEGNRFYQITDYVRRDSLLLLFCLFLVLVVSIAGIRGFMSVLGMGFSFLVIFLFVLPRISSGANPVMIAILGSFFIVPATFFLSHGFNKKTVVAIAGTVVALMFTGLLAGFFVDNARLTGFSSEEAGFLQFHHNGIINIKGLLLAGIIIGVLGVLDDITISQSAVVFQLKDSNPKIKKGELYKRAMSVGKDHISSMVNTLVLVYTGAALPLLLLFINNPRPFSEVINYEIIADEIVRTLVGSVGLILAVPVTTFFAVFAAKSFKEKD
jgi:uncharacterized membrane protein